MEHDRPTEECHHPRPAQGAGMETCEKNSSAKENRPPRTTAPAKVAANRRNAQKSTGPRTPEGKARSRWNAVQHGLLAKRLLAPEATDGDAWTHLLQSLREDWHPEGPSKRSYSRESRWATGGSTRSTPMRSILLGPPKSSLARSIARGDMQPRLIGS